MRRLLLVTLLLALAAPASADAALTKQEVRRAAIADTAAFEAVSPEAHFEGRSFGCRKLKHRPASRCWVSIWGTGFNPLFTVVDEATGEGLESGEAWSAEFPIVVRGRSCRRAIVEDAYPYEPAPRAYNVCEAR